MGTLAQMTGQGCSLSPLGKISPCHDMCGGDGLTLPWGTLPCRLGPRPSPGALWTYLPTLS